ncbi:MAG TPA: hypothetical protein VFQ88_14060 [Nevskiaceae bacterium]|nr:hypothetical protein [Nevskiaceae bacterium]
MAMMITLIPADATPRATRPRIAAANPNPTPTTTRNDAVQLRRVTTPADHEIDAVEAARASAEWRLLRVWSYLKGRHDPSGGDMLDRIADARARRSAMNGTELAADDADKQRYVDTWPTERDEYHAWWAQDVAEAEADAKRREHMPLRQALADVDGELLTALGVDLTPGLRVVR